MKIRIIGSIILALFFIVLSESLSITTIIVAVLISLLVISLNCPSLSFKKAINKNVIVKGFVFLWVLIYEVIKSNIQVAIIVLSKDMNISPEIVKFESVLSNDIFLATLANVITLTPGTMTIDIKGRELLIHCLNSEYKNALHDMQLESLLYEIEGELYG